MFYYFCCCCEPNKYLSLFRRDQVNHSKYSNHNRQKIPFLQQQKNIKISLAKHVSYSKSKNKLYKRQKTMFSFISRSGQNLHILMKNYKYREFWKGIQLFEIFSSSSSTRRNQHRAAFFCWRSFRFSLLNKNIHNFVAFLYAVLCGIFMAHLVEKVVEHAITLNDHAGMHSL